MKRNPTLIEGSFIAVLLALLITSAVILDRYESRKLSPLQVAETPNRHQKCNTNKKSQRFFYRDNHRANRMNPPTFCPILKAWQPYEMKIGDFAGRTGGRRTSVTAYRCDGR
jgi:hypothetical protein